MGHGVPQQRIAQEVVFICPTAVKKDQHGRFLVADAVLGGYFVKKRGLYGLHVQVRFSMYSPPL